MESSPKVSEIFFENLLIFPGRFSVIKIYPIQNPDYTVHTGIVRKLGLETATNQRMGNRMQCVAITTLEQMFSTEHRTRHIVSPPIGMLHSFVLTIWLSSMHMLQYLNF